MNTSVLSVPDPRHHCYTAYDRTRPQMIGSFSLHHRDDGEEVVDGNSLLRAMKLPQRMDDVYFDLKEGYVRLKDGGSIVGSKLDYDPGLSHILQWILMNKTRLQKKFGDRPILGTDFVTSRGILTKVMYTPYERFEGWNFGATKYKGVIYMRNFTTEKEANDERNICERDNLGTYCGHRFEHFVTESLDKKNDFLTNLQDRQEAYYAVVQTSLTGEGHHPPCHRLTFKAEIDCVKDSHSTPDLENFVEIKMTPLIGNDVKRLRKFELFKLPKWWMQCYMTGTPEVLCGYRDDDNVVRRLERIRTPSMLDARWSPELMFDFLERFLDHVKRVATDDDPNVMYEFVWEARARYVTHRRLACTAGHFVLPQFFIDGL